MAWHTLKEATELTGRSRRSLYRDINSGRVSSEVGIDGLRRFETSELMRAYGALVPVAHPDTPELAQAGTASGTPSEPSPDMAALLLELRELKQEVRELKETLRRLEYKPEQSPEQSKPAPPVPKESAPKKASGTTWADLLNVIETD